MRVERVEPVEPAAAVRLDEDDELTCPWCGEELDVKRLCPRRCFLSRVNRVEDL
jgi:DNA-directed RNA polymerase subunit N (RpoN/RPB10)